MLKEPLSATATINSPNIVSKPPNNLAISAVRKADKEEPCLSTMRPKD